MGKGRGRGMKQPQGKQPAADSRRIIPLGGGEWAYVFDAEFKTHHVRTDSQEFRDLVAQLNETMNGRGDKELERLGWTL